MEKSSERLKTSRTRKKPFEKVSKLKPKSSSFLIIEPSTQPAKLKVSQYSSYKTHQTPLKTRASTNKENSLKTDPKAIYHDSLSKPRMLKQNSLRKKSKKIVIKRISRGDSLNETAKRIKGKDKENRSKSALRPQQSQSSLKPFEVSNSKLTPRSSHPSPQHSHRTPDTTKLSQRRGPPVFTEKKCKIPEVGYFCKRISLFDKTKLVYTENSEPCTKKLNEDVENPFEVAGEAEDYSDIAKKLVLDSASESPNQIKNNTSPLKRLFEESTEKPMITAKPSPDVIEKTESLENFIDYTSPTKVIQVYNSPELKRVQSTPDSCKKRTNEPKAPRKTFTEFDSPGSFVFSLSSNSSEDLIKDPYLSLKPKNLWSSQIDEACQTDLNDIVTDSKVIEGLKLIGKLSEIISMN